LLQLLLFFWGLPDIIYFNQLPVEMQKPIVGDFAPEFSLIDLKGGTVRLSDVRGKLVRSLQG